MANDMSAMLVMTTGPRTHKSASLHLIVPTGVSEDMRDGMREIISLTSADRGKGHAKALLWQVCSEADRAGMVLLLTAKPFAEGMTQEQIEKFYSGHGFVRIQDEPVLMARQAERPRIARVA